MNESDKAPQPDSPDRVHVSILLDRSGSMQRIVDDTIGGFNTFLAEQQKLAGECRLTLVQFDGEDPQEVIADAIPVAEMIDLTAATFQPRGSTPLLDACGMLIERLDQRVADDPDESQLVAVITDGHENASSDFTRAQIADRVKERSDADWAFVFLGANIDSFAEAGSMGMQHGQAAQWDHSADGVRDGFAMLSASSRNYRQAPDQAAKRAMKDRLMDEARDERSRNRPSR